MRGSVAHRRKTSSQCIAQGHIWIRYFGAQHYVQSLSSLLPLHFLSLYQQALPFVRFYESPLEATNTPLAFVARVENVDYLDQGISLNLH